MVVSDLRRPRVESMENSLVRKDMVGTVGVGTGEDSVHSRDPQADLHF